MRKILVTLAAVAMSAAFALAGAGQASANPGVCVSGPFGYAYACVQGPGWVDWWRPNWHPGKNWDWNPGRGHGHWR